MRVSGEAPTSTVGPSWSSGCSAPHTPWAAPTVELGRGQRCRAEWAEGIAFSLKPRLGLIPAPAGGITPIPGSSPGRFSAPILGASRRKSEFSLLVYIPSFFLLCTFLFLLVLPFLPLSLNALKLCPVCLNSSHRVTNVLGSGHALKPGPMFPLCSVCWVGSVCVRPWGQQEEHQCPAAPFCPFPGLRLCISPRHRVTLRALGSAPSQLLGTSPFPAHAVASAAPGGRWRLLPHPAALSLSRRSVM